MHLRAFRLSSSSFRYEYFRTVLLSTPCTSQRGRSEKLQTSNACVVFMQYVTRNSFFSDILDLHGYGQRAPNPVLKALQTKSNIQPVEGVNHLGINKVHERRAQPLQNELDSTKPVSALKCISNTTGNDAVQRGWRACTTHLEGLSVSRIFYQPPWVSYNHSGI